jgi:POB3-like N-terminal PH domain
MSENIEPVIWKHIGLHGHSVGTLVFEPDQMVWRSAVAASTANDDDDNALGVSGSSRTIPKSALSACYWTMFGRSGHLRVQTDKSNHLKHELRFDGFPAADFELVKKTMQNMYGIELSIKNMSAAGTQYGLTTVKGKNLVFRHCILEGTGGTDNEEGEEFEPRPMDEMMSLDLAEVTQCVLPGNNRNEIEVQFPESDAVEAGTDQLGTSETGRSNLD